MIMKNILTNLFCAGLCLLTVVACDDMGDTDNSLSAPVSVLIEPADGKEVVLETSEVATVYFEWEYVTGSGTPAYQLVFDKTDGDFSNPLFVMNADGNGLKNCATLSHKQINKIASMAGIPSSETGTVKWTVLTTKGTKALKGDKTNNLTVTRLGGFEELPVDVYITGAGSEAGEDGQAKAYKMKSVASGEFEVYTYLKAGTPYYFLEGSETSDAPRKFYTDGGLVKENGTSTVDVAGVYKLCLDFNIGSFTSKMVTKVNFFINSAQVKIELPYKGLGVWELTDYTVTGVTDTDDRYKFRMESSTGETEWRAEDNDSKPNGTESYYYMIEKTNVEQWTNGQIWKSPSTTGWSDKTYDITFSLNSGGPYTHNLVIK